MERAFLVMGLLTELAGLVVILKTWSQPISWKEKKTDYSAAVETKAVQTEILLKDLCDSRWFKL